MKNNIRLGLGILTVLATPFAVDAATGSNEAHAAQDTVKSVQVAKTTNKEEVKTTTQKQVESATKTEATKVETTKKEDTKKEATVNKEEATKKEETTKKDASSDKQASSVKTVSGKPQAPTPNAAEKKTGWTKAGNTWFYYDAQGNQVKNTWVGSYWIGSDGKMVTNSWVDGGKYYVGSQGWWVKDAVKKTGWTQTGNTWYLYDNQGNLVKNAWSGNYWLGSDGKMVTNSWVDDGKYYVGSDGKWVKDAKRATDDKKPTEDKKPAEDKKSDTKKTGWVQTGSVWYHYNNQGELTKNAWVGSYWVGSDGKMVTNSWVDGGKYYVGNEGWYIPNYKLSVPALNMPQYYQSDARWGRKVYGIANMTRTGCVPTALAMAFSGLGKPVTPVNVADVIYYNTKEFNVSMIGTSGAGADYAIKHYNFKNTVIKSKEQLVQALHTGNPVFALVGNGDFVKGYAYTHGIMLSGYQNGKTKAMDPDSAYNTNKWYNVDRIWDQRSTDPYDTMLGGSFMLIEKK